MKQSPSKLIDLGTLLAVVVVGGFLVAILFPILMSARVASAKTNCLSNLKTLGLHAQLYASDHDFFVDPHRWSDLLVSEHPSSAGFTCLRSSGIAHSYAMSADLFGKRWSSLPAPENHLAFFDSKVMKPNAFGDLSLLPAPPGTRGAITEFMSTVTPEL